MPKLKGFIRALLCAGLIIAAIIAVGIPLFVSTQIIPSIRKESAAGFPEGNLTAIKDFVDKNSEPWEMSKGQKYMGFDEPTESEITALRKDTDLSRRYPTSLKAIFDPGAVSNAVDLLYYNDELADLGVNTFWVIGEYRMSGYKVSQFSPSFDKIGFPKLLNDEEADRVLAWRILLAKRLGFATIVIPDYPSLFNIGRENFDLDKVEPELVRVALGLAKIAEENGAEYLAPVNEYNHLLISNGYSMDEIVRNEKRFYGDLLPEIRKIFHGKIVIKNGAVNDWNNFKRQSMVGADLFGVGNAFTGVRTKENMQPKVEAANFVSARDGVPWFESEFVVYRPIDQEHWMGYVESITPIEKTYRDGLDIFERTAKGAIGFTFMSWTGVGKIRGTAAAEIMKDFFNGWQPTPKLSPDQNAVQPFLADAKTTLIEWFKNLPNYYSLAFDIFTGKMGPGTQPQVEDPRMGEGGLPCKGKEECDAYCAKPENRAECERVKGGGGLDSGLNDQNQESENGPDEEHGGPGGCKSEAECRAYCDKPENKAECMQFQSK